MGMAQFRVIELKYMRDNTPLARLPECQCPQQNNHVRV